MEMTLKPRVSPSQALMMLCVLRQKRFKNYQSGGLSGFIPFGRYGSSVWHRKDGIAARLIAQLESKRLVSVTRRPCWGEDLSTEVEATRDYSTEDIQSLVSQAKKSAYWKDWHWQGLLPDAPNHNVSKRN